MAMRAVGWARSFPIANGVRAGRRWTTEHLELLGWTSAAPETADAVLLTVSELLTNAHRHAHSTAQLILAWDGRTLEVSVADSSAAAPTPGDFSPERTSGRGLAIVHALADDLTVHPQSAGKTLTARFHVPEHPAPSGS